MDLKGFCGMNLKNEPHGSLQMQWFSPPEEPPGFFFKRRRKGDEDQEDGEAKGRGERGEERQKPTSGFLCTEALRPQFGATFRGDTEWQVKECLGKRRRKGTMEPDQRGA